VKGLKDEPEGVPAQARQAGLGHPIELAVFEGERTGGGPLEAAEQVQQGGLAAAAGADDGHRFAAGDGEGDVVDRSHQGVALPVLLAQTYGGQ
jgi:hypothetical protein